MENGGRTVLLALSTVLLWPALATRFNDVLLDRRLVSTPVAIAAQPKGQATTAAGYHRLLVLPRDPGHFMPRALTALNFRRR